MTTTEQDLTTSETSDDATGDRPAKVKAADLDAADTADADSAEPARPRRTRKAKAPAGFELVLTVKGSGDAMDWSADVTQGGKRVVAGLVVPASAVSAAAKDLHPEIADAIEGVLSAAREKQRSRVEQLQAELEAAQRALADLQE